MSLHARIWLAVGLLAAIHAGHYFIVSGYAATETVLPETSLDAFPMEIDGHEGETTELDEDIFDVLQAEAAVSRLYRGDGGKEIAYHNAAWTDTDYHICPHEPEICYSGAGWTIQSRKTVDVKTEAAPPMRARLLTMTREGTQIQVLYWYQMGPHTYWDRNGGKVARRNYWGEKTWPATLKFMLQTGASQDGSSEKALVEFAGEVYGWSRVLK